MAAANGFLGPLHVINAFKQNNVPILSQKFHSLRFISIWSVTTSGLEQILFPSLQIKLLTFIWFICTLRMAFKSSLFVLILAIRRSVCVVWLAFRMSVCLKMARTNALCMALTLLITYIHACKKTTVSFLFPTSLATSFRNFLWKAKLSSYFRDYQTPISVLFQEANRNFPSRFGICQLQFLGKNPIAASVHSFTYKIIFFCVHVCVLGIFSLNLCSMALLQSVQRTQRVFSCSKART